MVQVWLGQCLRECRQAGQLEPVIAHKPDANFVLT